MAPSEYRNSRALAASTPGDRYRSVLIDGRPYLPNLAVDASDPSSVIDAALIIAALSVHLAVLVGASDVDEGGKATAAASAAENYDVENVQLSDLPVDWESISKDASAALTCVKVTGGMSNALYRVSGFKNATPLISKVVPTLNNGVKKVGGSLIEFDSLLIRIFGAEGMIDRDVETSTYASLVNAGVAYRYLGRFGNGRVEGWLEGYSTLKCEDLTHDSTSLEIAREMARLHCLFEVPEGELRDHHCGTDPDTITVGLWDQLSSWMDQAKGYTQFKTPHDTDRVKALELDMIEMEVKHFIAEGTDGTASVDGSSGAGNEKANNNKGVVFCHNDLLPANIMRNPTTNHIQLIDFEYGGTNYAAFDLANHFNEYAGGITPEDNGVTDYSRFPSEEKQRNFCREYVEITRRLNSAKSGVTESDSDTVVMDASENLHADARKLYSEVQRFIMINHLYWGLWAVNQAAEEGCEEFDYVKYATNRFKEFYVRKTVWGVNVGSDG